MSENPLAIQARNIPEENCLPSLHQSLRVGLTHFLGWMYHSLRRLRLHNERLPVAVGIEDEHRGPDADRLLSDAAVPDVSRGGHLDLWYSAVGPAWWYSLFT